jgi:cobalt-zinc-cadmium efflux system outer membrane protein
MKEVAVILVALAIGVPARADAPAPVGALLADPAQLAAWLRERDPMLESARRKVEAANELGEQTHVLPNPQLQAAAGGFVIGQTNSSSTPQVPLSLGQTTNFQVGLGELIELGKRGPRQSAAELRAREAGETAVGALGMRLGEATAALGQLAYVASKRDAVAANLTAAKQLRDLEKNRLDKQDLSALDFGRIELDTEALERQLAHAEADLTGALAVCSAVIYAPCSADGLDPKVLDAAAPLPDALPAVDEAIEHRPVREASRLEAHALGQDATLAHNRRIPDVTLGVAYLLDNLTVAGNQHQQLIFSAAIPLPFFDRGDHDAAAARANAHAIEAEDRAAVIEAHGAVVGLLATRAALQSMLQKLESEAVPKSTQIIAQTRLSFDRGQARLADLLLVERAHRDLLLEVLDTRHDLFTVRAQLRQALGLDDQVARAAGGKR